MANDTHGRMVDHGEVDRCLAIVPERARAKDQAIQRGRQNQGAGAARRTATPSTLMPISSPPMPGDSAPRNSARPSMVSSVAVLAQLPVRPRVWMLPVHRWMPS